MSSPEIDILMASKRNELAAKCRSTINSQFRINFITASTPQELRQGLYATDPDLLIFEEGSLRELIREGHLGRDSNQDIIGRRFVLTLGEDPGEDFPVSDEHHINLAKHPEEDELIESVDHAAEELGYMTAQGDVDQRLVQRHLDVLVKVNGGEMTGYTTGINLNGCGVQVVSLIDGLESGDECRVQIDEADFQGFLPAGGEIIEVAESWEDKAEGFLRIRFTGEGFPSNDVAREVLEDMINRQDDESVSWS
ncbi:MAG: hypothetical protein ABEK50_05535 [bacterium]